MKVFLRAHGVELPKGEHHRLITRLQESFARLAARIERLDVSLSDANGPRGGRDKVCLIRVSLRDGRSAVVRERNTTYRRAIATAIRRMRAQIALDLKEARGPRLVLTGPSNGMLAFAPVAAGARR